MGKRKVGEREEEEEERWKMKMSRPPFFFCDIYNWLIFEYLFFLFPFLSS